MWWSPRWCQSLVQVFGCLWNRARCRGTSSGGWAVLFPAQVEGMSRWLWSLWGVFTGGSFWLINYLHRILLLTSMDKPFFLTHLPALQDLWMVSVSQKMRVLVVAQGVLLVHLPCSRGVWFFKHGAFFPIERIFLGYKQDFCGAKIPISIFTSFA